MDGEDDYEVVSFEMRWPSLSILLFLLTLATDELVELQPWRPQRIWLWPLIPPLVIAGLSFLGLVCGWIGLKVSAKKRLARTGMFLNAIVLSIVLSIVATWYYIVAVR